MMAMQKKRLEKELRFLKESLDAGLITKAEYLRGKERIEAKLHLKKNPISRSVRVTKKEAKKAMRAKKPKIVAKKKKAVPEIFLKPKIRERADLWKAATLVLGFLLIISILSYGFRGPAKEEVLPPPEEVVPPVAEIENEIIFLNSDGCTALCDEMEPRVREVAERLGFGFRTIKYFQPVPIPGYVLVYNSTLQVSGIRSYEEFLQELCDITKDPRICG